MTRTPTMVAFVAALAAIALTVSLGNWQLRRADEKLALQAAWDRAEQTPALPVAGVDIAGVADRLPLRVRLRGRFVFAHEVWLDNRRDPRDRTRLPAVARPEGEVTVDGLAMAHTARVLQLGENAPAGGGPVVWQNLDYESFERASGLSVARWVVQQTNGADDGLLRNWPRFSAGVDKHYGYALQWFALAVLITALTAFFGLRALRRRSRRT